MKTFKTYLCWLPGKYIGGAEKYGLDLSFQFAKESYKVYILCPYAECYSKVNELISNEFANSGLHVAAVYCKAPSESKLYKLPLIRKLHLIYWVHRYHSIIKDLGPHAIHIILPFPSRSFSFILSAIKFHIPVTITFQLVPPSLRINGRYLRLFRSIVDKVRFISVSDNNRDNLAKLLSVNPDQIHTIPNRPKPIRDQISQSERVQLLCEFGLDTTHFICTTVAALVPRKGYEDVIRACRFVVDQDPSYRFLFIGTGPHEATLRLLVEELKLTDNIFFLGHRTDVHHLLQLSQAFVFPSMSEGLSFALMEAVQYNVPLIASTQCGADEFLIPTLHFKSYENGDILTLSHHLLSTRKNYHDATKTATLAAQALQKYSYTDMITDTSAIIFRS